MTGNGAGSHEEIAALVATMSEAERRLEELTGGQTESVQDATGESFLLRRGHERLRRREADQQAAILNALPAHIALLDSEGRIAVHNEGWLHSEAPCPLSGADFPVGSRYVEACDQMIGAAATAAHKAARGIRTVLGGAPTFAFEYRTRVGKEDFWFLMTVTPLSRRGARGAVVMHLNISARRRALRDLRASEERFKALFDQAAIGVALADATTGRFLQVNRRFADITGRSPEELMGLAFAEITHAEDLDRYLETMQRMRTGDIREFTREQRYLRKDGAAVWVDVTVSVMWAPTESPSQCSAVVQDITGRKELEERIRQAQKMDAIGTLAGGIAHDFNNILAAIGGYTELARLSVHENPGVLEDLDAVLQAVRRASDLVRQILTFSRQQVPERKSVQLAPIVRESFNLLRASIPATIEFDLQLAPDAPNVLADASQVHQVLMNLGTNAWHAMRERTGRLTVTLERAMVDDALVSRLPKLHAGPYARLSVRDTGDGMDEGTMRRIFEPFFTTKAQGDGTGLGLAVVHGIMDTHGGAIAVESTVGTGTVFTLYFPANDTSEPEVVLEVTPTPRGHGERILVVDDEVVLARMMHHVLTSLGYEVETSNHPVAALELVSADPARFDLVLSDLTMPGMTGLELAARLREVRADLPIVLVTGNTDAVSPSEVEARGLNGLLNKPASIHELGSAVHATLSS